MNNRSVSGAGSGGDLTRTTSYGRDGISPVDQLILWARSRRVLTHVPPLAGVVADLGCGFEALLLHSLLASGRATSAIGVDLDVTVPRHEKLTLSSTDLNGALPIEDEAVDVAVSMAVLEHLTAPERLLAESFRILRPGGRLVLTTPTPRAKPVLEAIAYRLHLIDADEIRDHKHYFTGSELRGLAHGAGFGSGRVHHQEFAFGFNQVLVASK